MGSETLNELTGIWGLGLLIGMQHALEADHVAAVSSLVSRDNAALRVVSQGVAWALGHAMILILVGGGLLIFGAAIADAAALWLEATVGAMLIVLGGHVLLRLRRERVHFHRHGHADGTMHWHPHSHLGQAHPHQRSGHDHSHALYPAHGLVRVAARSHVLQVMGPHQPWHNASRAVHWFSAWQPGFALCR